MTINKINTCKQSGIRISIDTTSCYAINFDLVDNILQEGFVMPLEANTKIKPMFLTCEKTWVERRPGYYAKCMSLLYEIIYLMQTELNSNYIPASKKEKPAKATEYIHSGNSHLVRFSR